MDKFEYQIEELFQHLQEWQETDRIEAKKATHIGSSIMQTICAFANTPNLNGGYLLLGVSEPDSEHEKFWVSGVENADKLLNELHTNCRDQFEQPITVYSKQEKIAGKLVIGIYVPELSTAAKPCTFKGKPDSKNKRKTGVWLRGGNGDYEASQRELEPLILAKSGSSYESTVLPDTEWSDLDPNAIKRYRELRERIYPNAIELQENDQEMLLAMNLVKRKQGVYTPNIAGLLLFGKATALRRLLPSARVDYVRVQGTEWDQDNFIETLDLREPLIYTVPKLESKILSDMPHHFRLEPNQLQRSDTPILPYKVVRESVVNAVMHRDYWQQQPTLIVRYDDRLEMENAGYSLKPINELGTKGSQLRNPILAQVFYDIRFAETKGSGIGIIRKQLKEAQLKQPTFKSDLNGNCFSVAYSFNQLLSEQQFAFLAKFAGYQLKIDETMALVLAKETGRVSNVSLREVSDLTPDNAHKALNRLVNDGLLLKHGIGRASYYELSAFALTKLKESQVQFAELNGENSGLNTQSVELNQENDTENGSRNIENRLEIIQKSGINTKMVELNDKKSGLNNENVTRDGSRKTEFCIENNQNDTENAKITGLNSPISGVKAQSGSRENGSRKNGSGKCGSREMTREREKAVLALIRENKNIKRPELSEKLNVSLRTISRHLEHLKQQNKITFIGNPKTGYWQLHEEEKKG